MAGRVGPEAPDTWEVTGGLRGRPDVWWGSAEAPPSPPELQPRGADPTLRQALRDTPQLKCGFSHTLRIALNAA